MSFQLQLMEITHKIYLIFLIQEVLLVQISINLPFKMKRNEKFKDQLMQVGMENLK